MNFSDITDGLIRFAENFIPEDKQKDQELYRKATIFAWICLGVILICTLITLADAVFGDMRDPRQLVVFIGFLVVLLFLLKRGGNVSILSNVLMGISFAFVVFLMNETGGLLSPLVIYLMIVPAFVVLIADTVSVVIWTLAGVVAVAVFHYLHVQGVLGTQIKNVNAYLPNATANYISAIIFIAGLFLYSEISRRKAREEMLKAKKRSDDLLLNILPEQTANELKETGTSPARLYDSATVLFTDFKGFTVASESIPPQELLEQLNAYFMRFDVIMERHGLEKIKTIGDAYMAVGGLPTSNSTHAVNVVNAALEIRDFMVSQAHNPHSATAGRLRGAAFEIRIGIHTGPVVAGIVGIKKFAYDIWGDTVNTASRMESSGEVGKVNISETTYNLVKDKFTCEYRGEIEAKGKGKVKMYFAELSSKGPS